MARVSLVIVAAVAGVALAGFGLVALDDRGGPPIVIDDPRADATVVVAVDGAVVSPGIYALAADARVQDALTAAGGLAPDADLAAINPARRLRDEDRIVVPRQGASAGSPERPAAQVAGQTTESASAVAGVGPAAVGAINLNTAPAADLETLPEIGPVLAQRIVDYRTAHGPFESVEELARVEGVSARTVETLRPLVTVGP